MLNAINFPSVQRLGGRGTFAAIRERGRRFVLHPLIAFSTQNDLGFDRLGISIGRSIGNAVTRNRLKRAIRESFRKRERLAVGRDIVVQFRRHELLSNSDYTKTMDDLIRQIHIRPQEQR